MNLEKSDDIIYENLIKWLSEEVVRQISKKNNDPDWMLELRLEALKLFKSRPDPKWWPDLSELDIDEIYFFANPKETSENAKSWDDVPENIKNTFDKLGIPQAEKEILAWVWAQYDSSVVYHSIKEELQEKWVIFEDMSIACKEHSELLRKYFMKAIPINDHKFASLHAAVWSSWTFLYIPAWIKIDEPLQSYFRMNVKAGWQFEHTIIVVEDWSEAHYIEWCSAPKYWSISLHAWWVEVYVWENAKLRYSSVENWSHDTYNLNTKRAIVQKWWFIEWVGWNLGAWVTMLYPCSVLVGDSSSASHIWVAFANTDQIIDTWAKVIHIWKDTTSNIVSKSLSKWWWKNTYRWYLEIKESAIWASSSINCDSLILDGKSVWDSYPYIKVDNAYSSVSHEASAWNLNEDYMFYLGSRWIGEDEAQSMLVNWFLSPVVRQLPLEYASEMNVIIDMELKWH